MSGDGDNAEKNNSDDNSYNFGDLANLFSLGNGWEGSSFGNSGSDNQSHGGGGGGSGNPVPGDPKKNNTISIWRIGWDLGWRWTTGMFWNQTKNYGTAGGMTMDWIMGTGPHDRIFNNDRVANAMRNSPGIIKARNDYYSTGKTHDIYTFGLKGVYDAGLNPIEQYVGSYTYVINVVGGNLQFTISNTTSFSSAAYHIWPNSWNWNYGPMGNHDQIYIFTELLRK